MERQELLEGKPPRSLTTEENLLESWGVLSWTPDGSKSTPHSTPMNLGLCSTQPARDQAVAAIKASGKRVKPGEGSAVATPAAKLGASDTKTIPCPSTRVAPGKSQQDFTVSSLLSLRSDCCSNPAPCPCSMGLTLEGDEGRQTILSIIIINYGSFHAFTSHFTSLCI